GARGEAGHGGVRPAEDRAHDGDGQGERQGPVQADLRHGGADHPVEQQDRPGGGAAQGHAPAALQPVRLGGRRQGEEPGGGGGGAEGGGRGGGGDGPPDRRGDLQGVRAD